MRTPARPRRTIASGFTTFWMAAVTSPWYTTSHREPSNWSPASCAQGGAGRLSGRLVNPTGLGGRAAVFPRRASAARRSHQEEEAGARGRRLLARHVHRRRQARPAAEARAGRQAVGLAHRASGRGLLDAVVHVWGGGAGGQASGRGGRGGRAGRAEWAGGLAAAAGRAPPPRRAPLTCAMRSCVTAGAGSGLSLTVRDTVRLASASESPM